MRAHNIARGTVVVLVPLLYGVAELFRVRAEPTSGSGAAALTAIEANLGAYVASGWVSLVATVLTLPAFVVLYRIAAPGAPRWAMAGLVLAGGWALGYMAHLGGNYGTYPLLATHEDPEAVAEIYAASTPYWLALDLPWLVGMIAAPLVMTIALRRADALPRWSVLVVGLATVAFLLVGSGVGMAIGWSGLLVLGLAPVVSTIVTSGATPRPATRFPTAAAANA